MNFVYILTTKNNNVEYLKITLISHMILNFYFAKMQQY